jgi:hypothetical protein
VVGLSRRRFLGAAGALAGALVLGCGRDEARERPPADEEVLAGLLERERASAAAVGGVAGARAIARQDELHVERLAALAGVAGAAPTGGGDDPAAALARKQEGVFAYVDALPKLSDPDLRVLVMQLAASEAAHLAALRLAAGEEPVPEPFAGFTEAA